ncbi:hypothetical protein [Pontibacillus sp. HMF3514]|uniref:hypothetical protein n=1 Tax=Pontibacillus sp. HMF3514 TaxID=2692425 RepID=UPI001320024F|nr:hypothetical protein [Pontibacillus sp. HMF3514]QHE52774.1 hypothetical protein GS400_12380 [Pontibacillus sp. HMF3514]
MDKDKLREHLNALIKEYVEDAALANKLIETLDEPKAKYILAEIEMNKAKEYSTKSKTIIQDIAFYYC